VLSRYGRPVPGGRTIRIVSGDLDRAGSAEFLTGRATWVALAVFTAVIAGGAARVEPGAAATAAGAVVAVGAAALLVRGRRPQLLYAAIAAGGIAVLADGWSNNVGWFAVCLLAAWCVLTGGRREGLAYWAGAMILFAAEWLWVRSDPGWAAWLGGVTIGTCSGGCGRLRRDWPNRRGRRNGTGSPGNCTTSSGTR
jgi:hypothetical protein